MPQKAQVLFERQKLKIRLFEGKIMQFLDLQLPNSCLVAQGVMFELRPLRLSGSDRLPAMLRPLFSCSGQLRVWLAWLGRQFLEASILLQRCYSLSLFLFTSLKYTKCKMKRVESSRGAVKGRDATPSEPRRKLVELSYFEIILDLEDCYTLAINTLLWSAITQLSKSHKQFVKNLKLICWRNIHLTVIVKLTTKIESK
ncbi:hypothetical protein RND71_027439 [Anisodus tanguticus]|uniref:Uncharacterized protein n=1 Tax=Anisodus tanguticus TaxID=243964 RepID=A0AAE1RIX5_9SOLA|nr:hypothetical protein RND71_027439 [Anisodus tanguticus]